MTASRSGAVWLWLSVPIAVLGVPAALLGLFSDKPYARETPNWAAQAAATDLASLGVAFPALLILAFVALRGSLRARLAWSGVAGYFVYSYAIYAFDLHFGPLFLVYVAVFGLSVYAFAGGLISLDPTRVQASFGPRAGTRVPAGLLIALGTLFYLLWLSAVVPAVLTNTPPAELVEAGVPANPVHVLDMAIFLPAMLLTGVLLWNRRAAGYVLSPALLGAAALIGVGIATIAPVMALRGQPAPWPVAAGIAVLVMVELLVVVRFLGAIREDATSAV